MAKKKRRGGQMGRPPRGGRRAAKSRAPRIIGGVAIVAVLGIAVAAAGWWFLIRSDAELATSPLAISSDGTGSVPAANADGVSVLTIVATHPAVSGATQASYFADEKLASLSVPSKAQGTTNDVEGRLFLKDSGIDPSQDSTITIGLTSLRSDKGKRDQNVQIALLTESFPEATFVATTLSGYPSVFPENEEVPMQLTGVLTIAGVPRDVTWDVLATRTGDVMTALATLETRFGDWNVPVLNIRGFVTVEEDFAIQVQIIAVIS